MKIQSCGSEVRYHTHWTRVHLKSKQVKLCKLLFRLDFSTASFTWPPSIRRQADLEELALFVFIYLFFGDGSERIFFSLRQRSHIEKQVTLGPSSLNQEEQRIIPFHHWYFRTDEITMNSGTLSKTSAVSSHYLLLFARHSSLWLFYIVTPLHSWHTWRRKKEEAVGGAVQIYLTRSPFSHPCYHPSFAFSSLLIHIRSAC